MRSSEVDFLNVCHRVQVFLCVSNFAFHFREDGCFSDFYVGQLRDCPALCRILTDYTFRLFVEDDMIRIRVFENFSD